MKSLFVALVLAALAWADGPGVVVSKRSKSDFDLTADPGVKAWRKVPGVVAENDVNGKPVPGHRTEIRSRWTKRNLYFFFVCPYEELYLKPGPGTTTSETSRLWEWDVAEVFIGWELKNIGRYKEFEISPQGEWIDLDIDRDHPQPVVNWQWNSGFQMQTRIDRERKVWYGEMKIPLDQIGRRPVRGGLEFRINLYRIQGPPPQRKYIAWQPTHSPSYHTPTAFGRLRLGK
jgi:hypothetical protein